MTLYATGKKALGICDICGFSYKLRQLKVLVRNRVPTNLMACPTCWDPAHPQENQGIYRVEDAQALKNHRPDNAELPAVRAIKIQAPTAYGVSFVGPVGVSVS